MTSTTGGNGDASRWTFLTNHAHVLVTLHHDPDLRQRDIAALVGITEGAVQRILHELEADGYLEVRRIGRRNHYEIHPELGLRHPLEAGHAVGELLGQLTPPTATPVADRHRREPVA
jgi:DNA-binding IclR family transcriptional regulator